MILNTNPHNEDKPYGDNVTWQLGYFNECMSGFEHQVAAHMMAEGMVEEALILTRSVHDRYHALKRNPYNEIECSDHYARAMASYGTFITACGFEYHGPKGYIRFAPKLSPENFKAPFTAAEGWGTYFQEISKESFTAKYTLQFGQLSLKEIGLSINAGKKIKNVLLKLDSQTIKCEFTRDENDVTLILESPIIVNKGKSLSVLIT
jgi:non-lysosomal glucosylceramidase